jgi:hypothetical protein
VFASGKVCRVLMSLFELAVMSGVDRGEGGLGTSAFDWLGINAPLVRLRLCDFTSNFELNTRHKLLAL